MKGSTIPPMALAVVHGHAIFLDCAADRYFALSPGENEALIRLLAGEPISMRAQRALAAATGIEATAKNYRALLASVIPEVSMRASAAIMPPGWLARLSAFRHLVGARLALKVTGLHASLERLARHVAPSVGPEALQRRDDVVSAHDWLSRHVTANDACLVRSLALAHHLRLARCTAHLVIAVRSDPFAAHCWVQSNDRVLNEELDAVASFQPILVVR
jgi:hypothetical protein